MEEDGVVYLWRNKLWCHIIFFKCLFLSKGKNFIEWNLEQRLEFYGCEFKEGLSQNIGERDFILKASNAISDIWMFSKHRYFNEKTGWDVNMLDDLCITRNTRSL